MPRFEGEFPARSTVHDAGVVHRDVEPAKAIQCTEAGFLDRLRIADIELDGINLGTGRSDLRSGRVHGGGVDVGNQQAGPLAASLYATANPIRSRHR